MEPLFVIDREGSEDIKSQLKKKRKTSNRGINEQISRKEHSISSSIKQNGHNHKKLKGISKKDRWNAQRNRSKARKNAPTQADLKKEAQLTQLLFGDEKVAVEMFGKEKERIDDPIGCRKISLLFEESKDQIDEIESIENQGIADMLKQQQPIGISYETEDVTNETKETKQEENEHSQKEIWKDEDDENMTLDISSQNRLKKLRSTKNERLITGNQYSQRIRAQFERLQVQSSDWAKPSKALTEEDIVLQSSASVLCSNTSSRKLLARSTLDLVRFNDANLQELSDCVVQSTRFHPNNPKLLFTAGFDKTLRLFEIDGIHNRKLHSVFFSDLPIYSAEYTSEGREIIVTGRRKFFYCYDIAQGEIKKVQRVIGHEEKSLEKMIVSPDNKLIAILGNDGFIIMLSNQTKQWIFDLKINGLVENVIFSADSRKLYASGTEGVIYVFDLSKRRCIDRFADEGCLMSTSLAISKDNSFLATGSDSGVVNIYKTSELQLRSKLTNAPNPLKSLMHIRTSVSELKFNSDSQILAMYSSRTMACLKLVHVPSFTVFSNWPTSKTPLSFVTSFDFSPNNGLFVVGNDRGRVLLYRLNYYEKA